MNLILGSSSMIGKQLCELVPDSIGIQHIYYDLTDLPSCYEIFKEYNFETVYHLAGYNGGISLNLAKPADIFYTTSQINLNVLRCAQLFNVKRIVNVLASCSYPNLGNQFLRECDLFHGWPDPTVEPHGLAKRILLAYSRQLHKQYGLNTINAILTNCYGPGDRFNLSRTKVVGAAVRRICDAKRDNLPSVTFLGTGKPLREIMYCKDAASCLVKLAANYTDYMNPVNLGSNQEISIYDLAYKIKDLVGYNGEILWDESKPDGQMRKKLDTLKMSQWISHEMTPLDEGLQNTIKYYQEVGQYLDR